MKKIALIISLFVVSLGFAQDGKIKGSVSDGEMNNEPLAFAHISVKGTDVAVNADLDGNYNIEIAPGTYTLVFDFVGYNSVEVKNVVVKENEIVLKNETLQAKQLANNYLASANK
jgi:hypothetical protein